MSTPDRVQVPGLAIVVVNYGAPTLLERNLGSLTGVGERYHVVVVDNFSTDTHRAATAGLCRGRGYELVAAAGNPGFGQGVNAGVQRARELGAHAVLLLNPDALIDDDVISAMHEQVVATPDALVAPRILDSAGGTYFIGADVMMASGRIITAGKFPDAPGPRRAWLTGACLALDIELFDRVGGFDRDYFLYWEDVDFSLRIVDAGGVLLPRYDLTVCHDEGGTQGERAGRAKSGIYYRYNCRNRLVFGAAHARSRRDLLTWMVLTPRESWQILLRGGRRQLVHDPLLAWHALRGTLAGLRIAGRRLLTWRGAAGSGR